MVCTWIGHSPAVAATHYATSVDTDSDIRRALGRPNEAQQKAQPTPSAGDGQRPTAAEPEGENTPENVSNVACGQPWSIADKEVQWALQDSNL
jgi:hypothetical protein